MKLFESLIPQYNSSLKMLQDSCLIGSPSSPTTPSTKSPLLSPSSPRISVVDYSAPVDSPSSSLLSLYEIIRTSVNLFAFFYFCVFVLGIN
jgi:hypothetical protein